MLKELPKSFMVGPFEKEIEWIDDDHVKRDRRGGYITGLCNPMEHKIKVATRFYKDRQHSRETMIHEMIEAANDVNEWEMPHWQISSVSVAIYQALSSAGMLKEIDWDAASI